MYPIVCDFILQGGDISAKFLGQGYKGRRGKTAISMRRHFNLWKKVRRTRGGGNGLTDTVVELLRSLGKRHLDYPNIKALMREGDTSSALGCAKNSGC